MKLVALARTPARPDEAVKAMAGATGLSLAECRMRLAPEPPALLARLEAEQADALAATLRGAGLAALALDARVPSDGDRVVVRRFALSAPGASLAPRLGEAMEVAWPEVLAILRGVRASRRETERTEKSKRFSPGAAIATGGLVLRRSTERTVRSTEESTEQVVLVYARDGRAAILAEGELDFSCLGPGLAPSSAANVAEAARRLRERATRAFYDERLLRLGRRPLPFLTGGEWRSQAGATATTRTDTSGALDVLAEVMRRALVEGLLP
jgi:hypothetical protein